MLHAYRYRSKKPLTAEPSSTGNTYNSSTAWVESFQYVSYSMTPAAVENRERRQLTFSSGTFHKIGPYQAATKPAPSRKMSEKTGQQVNQWPFNGGERRTTALTDGSSGARSAGPPRRIPSVKHWRPRGGPTAPHEVG